ncbi:hypothetical protein AAFC00_002305 [Neodothiora populina]|uniref:DUF7082 domain-containing protein n=1 Tax=Neodothiora populina TaxID=2781224 RepID=A0ABR3PHC3_9PEZI
MPTQLSPRAPVTPIIVDEESILPDSLVAACQEAQKGGLLASSEYGSLIASMSGYEKNPAYAYDYGTATRPDQAPAYPAFVQPSYAISYAGTHAQVPSGLPNAAELPLLSEDQYQTHDANYSHHNGSYSSFIPAQPRHVPEITSFSPAQGPAGRKLFLYLNSSQDLQAPPASTFAVVFGSKRCEGTLLKMSNQSQQCNYALTVDVPPFDTTGATATTVPLYLQMSEGGNASGIHVDFGHFIYTDATAFQLSSPSQSTMRKRKLSPTEEDMRTPSKRPSNQQLRDSPINSSDGSKTSPISATIPEPYTSRPHSAAVPYERSYNAPQHQYSQSVQSAPGYAMGQQYGSTHGMGAQEPQYNSYPPYMTTERASAPAQPHIMGGSTANGANPPLVRTTALHGSPTSAAHPQPATFNPYAIYPANTKATLKLEGDLDGMSKNWTAEERTVQRRIVRFRRSQSGSTISAAFEPVTPEEHAHAPGCIYVNCIWWAEREACYITSVDTIQLLESLVAVRFTVEEKNRIRRNLEGFRPMTVSKTRPDCEEFFKVIMGFPSPKPRNIEKDVKVFPWRILAHALKKIIGKYSASYSSTAAALPSPGMIAPGRQQMPAHSPPSADSSGATMGYPGNMTSTALSAHHAGLSGGMAGVSAGHPELRLGIPVSQSVSWHQPSTHYTNDLSAAGRGSWDFSQYLDPSPTNPGMQQFQRIPSISQSLGYGFVPQQQQQQQHQPQQQDWKDYPHRTTHA